MRIQINKCGLHIVRLNGLFYADFSTFVILISFYLEFCGWKGDMCHKDITLFV